MVLFGCAARGRGAGARPPPAWRPRPALAPATGAAPPTGAATSTHAGAGDRRLPRRARRQQAARRAAGRPRRPPRHGRRRSRRRAPRPTVTSGCSTSPTSSSTPPRSASPTPARSEPADYRWHYLLGYLKSVQGKLAGGDAAVREHAGAGAAVSAGAAPPRPGAARAGALPGGAGRGSSKALQLDPKSAAAQEGLGKVAAAAGDAKGAIAYFQRALELDPQATGLHYALGQAYRNLGDLDRARAELEKGGDVPARISDPLINPLASIAQSAQFYLVQGAEAFDDKDYAERGGGLPGGPRQGRHQLPRLPRPRLRPREARRRRRRRAHPGTRPRQGRPRPGRRRPRRRGPSCRACSATSAALGGDDERALGRWRESLALVPKQPAVLLKAGQRPGPPRPVRRRGRDLRPAGERWRPTAAPAILEKRATALINLGRKEEAVADFRRAVAAAPGDARLRLRFAEALEFLGDRAGGAEQRAAAERLAPGGAGRAQLAADAARRLEAAGDYPGAIDKYRRVAGGGSGVARRPLRPGRGARARRPLRPGGGGVRAGDRRLAAPSRGAPRGRWWRCILGGRYGEARVALQEALKLFPREASLALTQVRLLATSPDPRVRDGELAVQIARLVYADSQAPPVRDSLALAYAAAGRFPEAADLERDLVAEAEKAGDAALAGQRRARLAAFERGEAWSAGSPEEIVAPLARLRRQDHSLPPRVRRPQAILGRCGGSYGSRASYAETLVRWRLTALGAGVLSCWHSRRRRGAGGQRPPHHRPDRRGPAVRPGPGAGAGADRRPAPGPDRQLAGLPPLRGRAGSSSTPGTTPRSRTARTSPSVLAKDAKTPAPDDVVEAIELLRRHPARRRGEGPALPRADGQERRRAARRLDRGRRRSPSSSTSSATSTSRSTSAGGATAAATASRSTGSTSRATCTRSGTPG